MRYIYPQQSEVSHAQRKRSMAQEPQLVWFTGLSGSGKSTLALRLEHYLFHQGYKVYLLDGDNVRNGLNKDLGFSDQDRKENLRRVGEVAKLMLDAGLVVLCAFISPYEEERNLVKKIAGEGRVTEVFVDCALEVCEQRDTKGLYVKARSGHIPHFTSISAPYQPPSAPDMVLQTEAEPVEACVEKLVRHVEPLLRIQGLPQAVCKG
ncbi:adenylyl-sulfate kinase [Pontibacter beigongshangensis]|uniref:adenylyl-sulfate kinase n=1 Tax=Pontibacter beigongshangensis TaxID=2574733 RepID=UPI00164FB1E1|nr:adenylyl-sulfate kinase [Pontibacter beigongshangensis]